MFSTDMQIAIVAGIIVSLLYSEVTGVLPAGLVVPGYLALYFDQPAQILFIFFLSTLVFAVVRWGIGRVVILYGRRLFAAMILTAVICRIALELVSPIITATLFSHQGVGFIVPGLIANAIHKQGLTVTLTGTFLVSGLTFLIMLLYSLCLR